MNVLRATDSLIFFVDRDLLPITFDSQLDPGRFPSWDAKQVVDLAASAYVNRTQFCQAYSDRREVKAKALEGADDTALIHRLPPDYIVPGWPRENHCLGNAQKQLHISLVGQAPLTISARMGTAELTVEEACSLRVGDVIRSGTGTSDPVPVLIEGQPAFLGRPFAAEDGTQMIKIAGDIPAGQVERYR